MGGGDADGLPSLKRLRALAEAGGFPAPSGGGGAPPPIIILTGCARTHPQHHQRVVGHAAGRRRRRTLHSEQRAIKASIRGGASSINPLIRRSMQPPGGGTPSSLASLLACAPWPPGWGRARRCVVVVELPLALLCATDECHSLPLLAAACPRRETDRAVCQEFITAGAAEVLAKPVNLSELAAVRSRHGGGSIISASCSAPAAAAAGATTQC